MIKVTEDFRIGAQVHVTVQGVAYERYVEAVDWDADPQAVTAQIANYLANLPQPPALTFSKNPITVTMQDSEVTAKLTALAVPNLGAATIASAPVNLG